MNPKVRMMQGLSFLRLPWNLSLILLAFLLLSGAGFAAPQDLQAAAATLPLVSGSAANGSGGGAAASAGGGVQAAVSSYYTVSGSIHTPSNAAVANVTLNGLPGNPSTAADGSYSASVSAGWSGTVMPVKTGWSFSPATATYSNVTADQTAQDYEGEGTGAALVYVNQAQTANPETGASWDAAFDTIQEGIDAAFDQGGGDVWVAAGDYRSTTDPVVTLREFVGAYGGFAGGESGIEERRPALNPTVIDGENARRCVVGANASAIDGFRIVSGRAVDGGGMYNHDASPYVLNCVFQFNAADLAYSNALASLPLLSSGSAGGAGGAAAAAGGGTADPVAGYGAGGAMCNHGSYAVVWNCTFTGNTSSEGGGAIYNYFSAPDVVNCIFGGNEAGTSALTALAKSLPLVGGQAAGGGAVAMGASGGGAAKAASQYGSGTGGAIRNDGSLPSVMNCTFSGNSAVDGGAFFSNSSEVTITNSILWNDAPNEISGDGASLILNVTYSDVAGGIAGTGNLVADPLFTDPLNSIFTLQNGSPCIDMGTRSDAPEVDILGAPRPQGNGFDMGAYETPFSGEGEGEGEEGVWVVDSRNTSGLQDGLSWDTAFSAIQPAIDAALAAGGGEVWVAAGQYTAPGSHVVIIKGNVSLYGGFAGIETHRDERDWGAYPTIIDGQSAHRCLFIETSVVLDGFSIVNGRPNSAYNQYYGAGALIRGGSSPEVRNCVFWGNLNNSLGGAVEVENASAVFTNCVFYANTAARGGAIYANTTTTPTGATFINCTFSGNSAKYTGGACYGESGTEFDFTNCILWGNTPSEIGPGATWTATYSDIKGILAGHGNINADPLFANQNNGDLRIVSGSPCIDSADPSKTPSIDALGVARPQGAGFDMGAYEAPVR